VWPTNPLQTAMLSTHPDRIYYRKAAREREGGGEGTNLDYAMCGASTAANMVGALTSCQIYRVSFTTQYFVYRFVMPYFRINTESWEISCILTLTLRCAKYQDWGRLGWSLGTFVLAYLPETSLGNLDLFQGCGVDMHTSTPPLLHALSRRLFGHPHRHPLYNLECTKPMLEWWIWENKKTALITLFAFLTTF
jgi:hypothetical protein